jgi:heme/copper-type cytochrome/quinol oxidase subunit 3
MCRVTDLGRVILPSRSEFAVRFAALFALLLLLAGLLATGLLRILPPSPHRSPTQFFAAFALSTLLLLVGSVALVRARSFVRRERQRPFRHQLLLALAAGTLFVASQTYALSCLIRPQPAQDMEQGAGAYVAVAATLHALHFLVALMILTFVTVQAFENRYDHEYYWGVTICGLLRFSHWRAAMVDGLGVDQQIPLVNARNVGYRVGSFQDWKVRSVKKDQDRGGVTTP